MRALSALLGLLIAMPSMAIEVPKGTAGDARVQRIAYDENQVVAVYAYQGVATHIVFAPGEEVLDMASGFSAGWEFGNRRNNLYLKPKSMIASDGVTTGEITPVPGRWDTNLIVTTDRRTYSFQLFLIGPRSPGQALKYDPRMAFRIQFSYPEEERAKARAAEEAARASARIEATKPVRNTNYSQLIGKRSKSIAPTLAYDDGTFTYLRFPNNREVPAAFLVAEDKSESLVNSHFKDDVLVIHRVAPKFVLRLGKQVVTLFNKAFDPDGVKPVGGTTVPGLERVIVEEQLPIKEASPAPATVLPALQQAASEAAKGLGEAVIPNPSVGSELGGSP